MIKRIFTKEHRKNISLSKYKFIIERELLKSLYLGNYYSIKEISEIFSCSVSTICRRLKEYNIPTKDPKVYTKDARDYILRNKDVILPRGKNHHNWKEIKKFRNRNTNDSKYKHWRYSVFDRDNYICKICGKISKGDIEAHHIKSWKTYIYSRFDVDNGITLCKECHKWIHKINPLNQQ